METVRQSWNNLSGPSKAVVVGGSLLGVWWLTRPAGGGSRWGGDGAVGQMQGGGGALPGRYTDTPSGFAGKTDAELLDMFQNDTGGPLGGQSQIELDASIIRGLEGTSRLTEYVNQFEAPYTEETVDDWFNSIIAVETETTPEPQLPPPLPNDDILDILDSGIASQPPPDLNSSIASTGQTDYGSSGAPQQSDYSTTDEYSKAKDQYYGLNS